ncbi:hypothetical protein GQ54DRAFT_95960 [Martensiomyces pterosporus]|nr:hypothetical protein GQ54DRAFT_95960 [Martensiomyces pterosporus]
MHRSWGLSRASIPTQQHIQTVPTPCFGGRQSRLLFSSHLNRVVTSLVIDPFHSTYSIGILFTAAAASPRIFFRSQMAAAEGKINPGHICICEQHLRLNINATEWQGERLGTQGNRQLRRSSWAPWNPRRILQRRTHFCALAFSVRIICVSFWSILGRAIFSLVLR